MANTFDPIDKRSWYFGRLSRQEATDLLLSEKEEGVFLVRDSSSIPGDFVLCVKEDSKVCHYIINKEDEGEGTKYRIGDRYFPDLSSLLSFYKLHYLDTTPLVRPATRRFEQVIAIYDFDGKDPEDLPFKKGEILTIIRKDEEQWWLARSAVGRVGPIPVPYVKPYGESHNDLRNQPVTKPYPVDPNPARRPEGTRKQYARVKQARVPNAYDETALKLQVGDIIRVTNMNISGEWEGELILAGGKTGRKGHFPFNFVELVDYDPATGSIVDGNNDGNITRNNTLTQNNKSPKPDSIQLPD